MSGPAPLSPSLRIGIIAGSLTMLAAVYVTQRFSYVALFTDNLTPDVVFIVNRTVRFLINDLLCIALIYALFQDKRYVRLAWYVFLVELLIILPAYFCAKLTLEGPSEISSPLLSPIHRIVVNPLLMFTLIAALYYQRWVKR